jgi:hypothetical protein
MPQKRKFKLESFLDILAVKSMSTGVIARKVKCHISTALRYLRELKKARQVIEQRISNTINLWRVTGKRILLIDVDSKIPNLALAKLSSWHKSRGDNVTLVYGANVDLSNKPDKVYASIIYKKNRHVLDYLISKHPDIDIDIGGSGYDLKKELPPEIETLKPDYSLYPEFDYSIGFSSRGCFRDCGFCIVRAKEGRFRKVAHPETWYNPKYKKIVFLDNNILTNRKHFMRITDWCIEKGLSVWFTQGLDIKRVNEAVARRLLEMKHFKMISSAWDNIKDEAIIREKIELLQRAGFTKNKLRAKVQFYVYVDSDSDEEYNSGVYRCRELKKLGCNSYVMYNINNERTQRIKDLKRWSNRKVCFWCVDIVDYKANIRMPKTIHAKSAKAVKA